jgi:hypothetical protein
MTQIGENAVRITVLPGEAVPGNASWLAGGRGKRLSEAGSRLVPEDTCAEARPVLTGAEALTTSEMSKAASTDGPTGPRTAKRQERAERLAAALKANLHRRKAQARERAAEAGQPDSEPAAPPRDEARPLKTPPDQEPPPDQGS